MMKFTATLARQPNDIVELYFDYMKGYKIGDPIYFFSSYEPHHLFEINQNTVGECVLIEFLELGKKYEHCRKRKILNWRVD